MQNLGQLGPENCRAYVFFAFFFCFVLFFYFFYFFFVFVFVFFLFVFLLLLFFFLLIAWSKFALIFHIARFQFQKYKIFSFWEGTSLRHPLCVQACNWRWRSTKSSPNVEDGCTALCSFGVLAVVKCCKQCFIAMFFFSFLIHKFPAILS